MTAIRYPFVRATSVLAPTLLLLLLATGAHAEILSHEFAIVSAPPITTDNEAAYRVSGDCTFIEGHNAKVTVTYSDPGVSEVVVVETDCKDTAEWSVEADLTGFGSGLVGEDGILKQDVEILAGFTDDNGLDLERVVFVYRNPHSPGAGSDLKIGLIENLTLDGNAFFHASATCGANEIIMDETGLITVYDTDCAQMVSNKNADAKLAMKDALTQASGACEFDTLTMSAAGDIQITVGPNERCLDDKDADGIFDLQDPEPGTGVNNDRCVDSQNLIDNIALTDAEELFCEAVASITVQGVGLQKDAAYCYEAGQFVRFAPPSGLVASVEPVFSVPSGTSFSIAVNGAHCGS